MAVRDSTEPDWGPHSGGSGVQGPEAEDEDRHHFLPPARQECLSPSPQDLCSLSLYTQGEGGVQAGGDGEDFCQVSDSPFAQDLRGVGAGDAVFFFCRDGLRGRQ